MIFKPTGLLHFSPMCLPFFSFSSTSSPSSTLWPKQLSDQLFYHHRHHQLLHLHLSLDFYLSNHLSTALINSSTPDFELLTLLLGDPHPSISINTFSGAGDPTDSNQSINQSIKKKQVPSSTTLSTAYINYSLPSLLPDWILPIFLGLPSLSLLVFCATLIRLNYYKLYTLTQISDCDPWHPPACSNHLSSITPAPLDTLSISNLSHDLLYIYTTLLLL